MVFVPCEKVLIDAAGNAVSALSIMQDLKMGVSAKALPFPHDSVAPLSWTILSIWDRQPNETTPFHIRLRIILPSGRQSVEVTSTQNFDNFTKRYQRVVTQAQAFPVGEPGEILLVLGVRIDGEEDFSDIATYPIDFSYEIQEQAAEETAPSPAGVARG
jgi:hypothetical protein